MTSSKSNLNFKVENSTEISVPPLSVRLLFISLESGTLQFLNRQSKQLSIIILQRQRFYNAIMHISF